MAGYCGFGNLWGLNSNEFIEQIRQIYAFTFV